MVKNINFIWVNRLGIDIPERYKSFISKWKTLHPDFSIKIWREDDLIGIDKDSFDELWNNKSICEAWITNVFRSKIIYSYGGVYCDIDTEPLRALYPLLYLKAGEEILIGRLDKEEIILDMNIFYSERGSSILKTLIDNYHETKESHSIKCPYQNDILLKNLDKIKVAPPICFQYRILTKSNDQYSVHWPHRLGSWIKR